MSNYPVMTAQQLRDGVYDNLLIMVKALLPKIPDCKQILMTRDVTDASDVYFDTSIPSKELRRYSRELVPEHIVDAEIGCACPGAISDYPKGVRGAYDITDAVKEVLNEI